MLSIFNLFVEYLKVENTVTFGHLYMDRLGTQVILTHVWKHTVFLVKQLNYQKVRFQSSMYSNCAEIPSKD